MSVGSGSYKKIFQSDHFSLCPVLKYHSVHYKCTQLLCVNKAIQNSSMYD